MYAFSEMEQLENNGFFTSTGLVKNPDTDLRGLWPDVDGNRNYGEEGLEEEDLFVLWIEDLDRFILDAMTVALPRVRVLCGNLLIEPNDGDVNAIQVRYANEEIVSSDGYKFIGMSCGADTGNFAVLWYTQSLLMMRLMTR